jgi:hypothetical protein
VISEKANESVLRNEMAALFLFMPSLNLTLCIVSVEDAPVSFKMTWDNLLPVAMQKHLVPIRKE